MYCPDYIQKAYPLRAGELTFVTASQVNKEGIAELIFTHASDYVLVIDNHVVFMPR